MVQTLTTLGATSGRPRSILPIRATRVGSTSIRSILIGAAAIAYMGGVSVLSAHNLLRFPNLPKISIDKAISLPVEIFF